MASVFRKDDNHSEKAKRNAFPKSFDTHITTKFGQILPVFCKPVMNGETIKIEPKFNLNFLPLVFPVQNRVRASLEFYYVRNRNLWSSWPDFQFKMKDGLVPPYHVFTEDTYRDMLRVGGLLDNLGVPTVLHGNYDVKLRTPDYFGNGSFDIHTGTYYDSGLYQTIDIASLPDGAGDILFGNFDDAIVSDSLPMSHLNARMFKVPIKVNSTDFDISIDDIPSNSNGIIIIAHRYVTKTRTVTSSEEVLATSEKLTRGEGSRANGGVATSNTRPTGESSSRRMGDVSGIDRVTSQVTSSSQIQYDFDAETEPIVIYLRPGILSLGRMSIDLDTTVIATIDGVFTYSNGFNPTVSFPINVQKQFGSLGVPLSDLTLDSLPFPYINQYGSLVDDDKRLHISSLPARGIKAIYNARIRNEANNPFLINGVPEYNKYIDNDSGGADSDYYPLYSRNWHDDCFTTALHSPQHGDAPLVGLVNSVTDPNYVVTFANDDGTKDRVAFIADDETYDVRVYPAGLTSADDITSDGYVGQLQEAMMEAVKFGITINDFRNVNSFQRWLENNVRKGYKYRDQIKAHYNVEVNFDTLDMPEYVGGMSRDMNVQQVTQTTENQYGNLGDFSGQAWIEGDMDHSISHYCDEEGFVIGLLSVVPIAPYSQVIPKYLLRESAFDWYSPEFGHIGMQPILKREIAPLASYYEDNGQEVFGYQRAWYDSIDGMSEVHGKFRTDFRNFVINRTFDGVPELGVDFLTMSDDDINSVFYVDDGEDKILGQIHYNYDSLLPIPVYGIPRLE